MNRCKSSSRRITAAFFATAVIAVSGSVAAQTVDDVLRADQRRLNLAQQSQERINSIVEGTRSLEDQYRAINKEIDGLKVYNRLMGAQVEGQDAVLEDIALSMDQVDVINRQIFPLMERMIDGLEQSVALDVPFLMDERDKRIDDLKSIMERSDVTVAEKFRKVMEAYQIENDFGRTVETYKDELEIEGGTREVDILRVGRVALLYQTSDQQYTGAWDQGERQWVELPARYRSQVRQGLRMAKKLVAPELLILPAAAPEATQ